MEPTVVIGTIGVSLTALQLLPQLTKVLRTKSARDLSVSTLLIILGGSITWCTYAILIESGAILVANVLNSLFAVGLLVLTVRRKQT